jgi:hypothetical protein
MVGLIIARQSYDTPHCNPRSFPHSNTQAFRHFLFRYNPHMPVLGIE